jgi:hypothetical protein
MGIVVFGLLLVASIPMTIVGLASSDHNRNLIALGYLACAAIWSAFFLFAHWESRVGKGRIPSWTTPVRVLLGLALIPSGLAGAFLLLGVVMGTSSSQR